MAEAQKILIVDAVPACAHGITHALRVRGYDAVEESAGLPVPPDDTPVLMTLRSATDWDHLRSHASAGHRCVVAVLTDADDRSYRRALATGARSAVAERAPVEEIVRVLEAALDSRTLLPSSVVAAIAADSESAGATPAARRVNLTSAETRWLRALAAGVTVAEIALESCYSQREMYRLLGQLYTRMAARNRAHAIVLATKWGLI